MGQKMQGIPVPDWNEIKSYFTDIDVQHMLAVTGGQLNLHDCASVLANAAGIYQQVSTGMMPPGNPWGPDKINGFFSWWKSNPTCPQSTDPAGPATRAAAAAATVPPATGGAPAIGQQRVRTSGWFAWNNTQPPGPASFHIVGYVEVPNPGVDVSLTKRVPQGINPAIILLDLHMVQRPGLWPQHVVSKFVHFEEANASYQEADVLLGTTLVAKVPVVDIS